jgi:DNA-binding LytR/AlgR family response regulator
MLRTIAIDDEPVSLEIIKNFSAKVSFIDLKACYTNAFKALEYMQREKTDLIFLDIKMPDISGMEFLKSLQDPPMTIFTTAYSEHAVESFELNALDYLLKPFSFPRFLKACNKAHDTYTLLRDRDSVPTASLTEQTHVFIKTGYEQVRVSLNEIEYVQSAGNYVQFVLSGQKILSRLKIGEVEALLPAALFTRVHRSYIVSNSKIKRIDRWNIQLNNTDIPIGPGYAAIIDKITKG